MLATAVALLWSVGCGADDPDPRVVAPSTPPPGQEALGTGSLPDGVSLVLASAEGVDLMRGDGSLLEISHRPAAAAYAARDDVVVFQGPDESFADVYSFRPGGPVEMWSDGSVRELPTDPDASSVRLLDAGVLDGRPVALERWSSREGKRAWSVEVAKDRLVDLVASDNSVAVVRYSFARRRGPTPGLTVTRHDPTTGEPRAPTVIDIVDDEGILDTGVHCRAWLTASELACGRSGGAAVAISLDGSFYAVGGPPGALPSVVRSP